MKLAFVALLFVTILAAPAAAPQREIPKDIAGSVGWVLRYSQGSMVSLVEAMPEEKFSFVPTGGNFEGVRSFGEQVKHVACAHFAFYNQIEGKTPPELCEKGGPSPAKTKAELVKYLRDSFDYGNKVLATIEAQTAMARVEGRYAGPNTRLGMAVTSVWHLADHYGQLAVYLRMNGIVPPATQAYPLQVR